MKLTKFKPQDLFTMKIQSRQAHLYNYLDMSVYNDLIGVTISDGDEILFCGGVHNLYAKRYVAWSVFAQTCKKNMVLIVREIKKYLANYHGRIECTCDVNFPEAHRLALILGFDCEAPRMREYEVDGRDMSLYAMINK